MVQIKDNDDMETMVRNLNNIKLKGKTVLATGGAGFLGSWICEVLVQQNARVICLDNLASGLKSNISHLLTGENFSLIKHDIAEPLAFDQKIDLVIHMASRASVSELDKFPLDILRANTLGTLNALEVARANKAIFLFTSTSEIYGKAAVIPTPESYNGDVNPVGARSAYQEAKRCGESFAAAYKKQYGLDVRIARIFNTYGPRLRGDGVYGRVISRFIDQALNNKPITVFGDGTQTRSFCYVSDQIEGLLKLAVCEQAEGDIINIGNASEIEIMDLANMIKRLVNSKSEIISHPLPEDDSPRRKPDITKAKKLLDWQPKVSLEEGLNKTIEWFKTGK